MKLRRFVILFSAFIISGLAAARESYAKSYIAYISD